MGSFNSRRYIATPPQTVWQVLTDPDTLVKGDFGIFGIEGEIAEQSKFKLRIELTPKQVFSLTVSEFIPDKRMAWRGKLPFGLFIATRQFELIEVYDGTDFHMREDFSGLLGRIIGRAIPDLQPSFDKFADALKAEAEARAA